MTGWQAPRSKFKKKMVSDFESGEQDNKHRTENERPPTMTPTATTDGPVYLNCPFSEKDLSKGFGSALGPIGQPVDGSCGPLPSR